MISFGQSANDILLPLPNSSIAAISKAQSPAFHHDSGDSSTTIDSHTTIDAHVRISADNRVQSHPPFPKSLPSTFYIPMELFPVVNTLLVALVSVAISLPVGVLTAYFLLRCKVRLAFLAWNLLFSLLGLPLYAYVGCWSSGIGLQGWLGLHDYIIPLTNSYPWISKLLAVSLLHAFAAIPWVVACTAVGLRFVDPGVERLSRLDHRWFAAFRLGTLSQLYSTYHIAAYLAIVPIVTEMVVTNLFQLPTVTESIYLLTSRGDADFSNVAWSSTVQALVLIAIFGGWSLSWGGRLRSIPARHQRFAARTFSAPDQSTSPVLNRLANGFVWGVILLLVVVPYSNLIVKAGWQSQLTESGANYYWSAQRFALTMVESLTNYFPEFYWSLLIAGIASVTAILVVVASALIATRLWGLQRAFALLTAIAIGLLAVPGPVVGQVVIWLLNRDVPEVCGWLYDRTIAAPVLAQQFRLVPVCWCILLFAHFSIPQSVRNAMMVDGLKGWDGWRKVVMPATWRIWGAGSAFLILLSIGELSYSILVLPPGVTTLSMRLFELLHFGMRHQDSGLCILFGMLSVSVASCLWKTLSDR